MTPPSVPAYPMAWRPLSGGGEKRTCRRPACVAFRCFVHAARRLIRRSVGEDCAGPPERARHSGRPENDRPGEENPYGTATETRAPAVARAM